jgi:2-haloacid dehalogenase
MGHGPQFEAIEACVFDAYGTLFDIHAPVARMASRIGPSASELTALWRRKQLEYSWLRSLMRTHADFWQVTSEALDYALTVHSIDDAGLRDELMRLYLTLEPYPDARSCLAELAKLKCRTAILSNGTAAMLSAAVTAASFGELIEAIISVEEVGVYKPDPRVYAQALERLAIRWPSSILFVSGNPWDAQAAANFGFRVARIDRYGLPDDRMPGRIDVLIPSLAEVPALLAARR